MNVLAVNAGSSSLKLRVLDDADRLVTSHDLRPDDPLPPLPSVDAVGHRIVHGGDEFRQAVVLDDSVVRRLEALTDLAPLHQPKSLAALRAVSAALPGRPAVACFDTAFHASLPAEAAIYPLPSEWRERYKVRRFGFHGLPHAYAARRGAELLDRGPADLRLVSCHLGSGASLAAVAGGRSVDTTMGFTPLDGLVMATRVGRLDPGLDLWLQEHEGLSEREIADVLEHRSGLLALAGTSDMREVLARDDGAARLALGVYLHRLASCIAAMTASLRGLDALMFTGGVGENSSQIRSLAAERLSWLGVGLDAATNARAAGDRDISGPGASVRTLVVHAREDLEIVHQVRRALMAPHSPSAGGARTTSSLDP